MNDAVNAPVSGESPVGAGETRRELRVLMRKSVVLSAKVHYLAELQLDHARTRAVREGVSPDTVDKLTAKGRAQARRDMKSGKGPT